MLHSTLLIIAPFALGAFAQSSSSSLAPSTTSGTASSSADNISAAETILTLFIDAPETDQRFAGSIVDANACDTTIAIAFTAGDYGFGHLDVTCDGSNDVTVVYQGSTGFGISTGMATASAGIDAALTITQSCNLEPTSSASCSVMYKASVEGESEQDSSTFAYSGLEAEQKWKQVPITAGAEKLPAEAATCTAEGNAAAPTGVVGLYKVVVVPGAAALLAGAAAAL